MTNFNYALVIEDYSWKNALLWGNFTGHCQKAMEGKFGDRIVHVLIAAIEFLPIIGQIASIFEKIIVTSFSNPAQPKVDLKPSDENVRVLPDAPVLSDEDKEIVKLQRKLHEIRERKQSLTEEFKKDTDPKELARIHQEAKDKYEQSNTVFSFSARQNMEFSEPDLRSKKLTSIFQDQIKRLNDEARYAFIKFKSVAFDMNFPQRKVILDSYRDEFGDMVGE